MTRVSNGRRLLVVTSFSPWPIGDGLTLRIANLLEHLAKGWAVTLVGPPVEVDPTARLPRFERHVVVTSAGQRKHSHRYDATPLVEGVLEAIRSRPSDAALLWAGSDFPIGSLPGMPPCVWDHIDCGTLAAWRAFRTEAHLRQRLSRVREMLERAFYERRLMGSVQATVLAGDADARVMRALSPGSLVEVIPNGVRVMDQGTIEESPEPTVIFSGVMAFPPNVEAVTFFCHAVWPHVREAVPTARFLIAGKHPVREVQNLTACAGVEVLGAVDDMAAVLGRAWVAVAPMRSGAGIKNKVLEAWAAGKPTVMTTLAVGGLHLVESERALVRDEPRQMAEVVSRLLLDGEERRRRGSVALEAVRAHHSWEGVAGTLSALLEHVRHLSGR